MFISAGISAIKYAYRSDPYPKPQNALENTGNNKVRDLSYNELLPNEKAAYDGYSTNGWRGNYPGQSPGTRAGRLYKNETKVLPFGNYREFDINSRIPGMSRDASRFVVSDKFDIYLTRNHYATFFRVLK